MVVARLSHGCEGKCVVHIMEWMNESPQLFGYILSVIMDHYVKVGVDSFNFWAGESTEEAKAAVRRLYFFRGNAPIIFPANDCGHAIDDMASNFKFYLGSSDTA